MSRRDNRRAIRIMLCAVAAGAVLAANATLVYLGSSYASFSDTKTIPLIDITITNHIPTSTTTNPPPPPTTTPPPPTTTSHGGQGNQNGQGNQGNQGGQGNQGNQGNQNGQGNGHHNGPAKTTTTDPTTADQAPVTTSPTSTESDSE